MSTTTTTTIPRGWNTRDEIAGILKIQPRRVDELRQLLPADKQMRRGARIYIEAAAITELWWERKHAARLKRNRRLDQEEESEDLEPEAGDSAALERLRAAKAALAELELARRKGQLVEVESLRAAMAALATAARLFGDRLRERYGQEAAAMFNEWLETAAAAVAQVEDA